MKLLSMLMITFLMSTESFAWGAKGKDQKREEFFRKELNMSEEQLAKVREIRSAKIEEVKAAKAKSKEAKKIFKEALKDPNSKKEDLIAKFDEFQKARDTAHRTRFMMMLEMRSLMNAEQIAKFSEWKEQHKGKRRGKRE